MFGEPSYDTSTIKTKKDVKAFVTEMIPNTVWDEENKKTWGSYLFLLFLTRKLLLKAIRIKRTEDIPFLIDAFFETAKPEIDKVCEIEEEQKRQLRLMPYKDYLLTRYWKTFREIVLKHHKHRCQICNSKHRLDVHHRTYARRGDELLTDVIVLCRTCHFLFHEKLKLACEESESA